jgi:hypothetical protein
LGTSIRLKAPTKSGFMAERTPGGHGMDARARLPAIPRITVTDTLMSGLLGLAAPFDHLLGGGAFVDGLERFVIAAFQSQVKNAQSVGMQFL